ncbi:MAG: response regulator, partial [Clostridia bacterium]|nr:response regulator [Clostridia bacterium]
LGGELRINSQPGLGTTVSLILNLQTFDQEEILYHLNPPQAIIEVREDLSPYQATKNILLVDDNQLNLEITSEFLQLEGFTVDIAHNGSEAVEKVRIAPEYFYDLILMDIKMPIMDGYQAARTIRKLNRQDIAHIPIIAMTANAFKQDQDKSNQSGMDFHLSKPIDFTTLSETLQKFLDKSESLARSQRD